MRREADLHGPKARVFGLMISGGAQLGGGEAFCGGHRDKRGGGGGGKAECGVLIDGLSSGYGALVGAVLYG